jgi:hypothetical protein
MWLKPIKSTTITVIQRLALGKNGFTGAEALQQGLQATPTQCPCHLVF